MTTPAAKLAAAIDVALADLGWDDAMRAGWAVIVDLQTLRTDGSVSHDYVRLLPPDAGVHESVGLLQTGAQLLLAEAFEPED